MNLNGAKRTPRAVELDEYVAQIEEGLAGSSRPRQVFDGTLGLAPPELVPSIHATLDGILTLSPAMYHTYPYSDPSSAFLAEALTNAGYVPDPARHFTMAENAPGGFGHERLRLFVRGFNLHMTGRYAIAPSTEVHEHGMALVRSPNGTPPDTSFANRVFVTDPRTKHALDRLRALSTVYRSLLNE